MSLALFTLQGLSKNSLCMNFMILLGRSSATLGAFGMLDWLLPPRIASSRSSVRLALSQVRNTAHEFLVETLQRDIHLWLPC